MSEKNEDRWRCGGKGNQQDDGEFGNERRRREGGSAREKMKGNEIEG